MARGTTLNELLRMVREETGQSTSAALGQNTVDSLKQKIRRQQEVLWNETTWPHLKVQVEIALQAGERYYNPPPQLSMNHRIESVSVYHGKQWQDVKPGITLRCYNWIDPDQDQREDPVRRWDLYESEQIELWPLPATNGIRVMIEGTRNLRQLVDDSDVADLDDRLITLFLAAEINAAKRMPNAQAQLSMAQTLLAKLKGSLSNQRRFSVGNRHPYQTDSRNPHLTAQESC